MKITPDVIFHMLFKRCGIRVHRYEDEKGGPMSITTGMAMSTTMGTPAIKTVRILRHRRPEAGHLYISDDVDMLNDIELSDEYALLYCGENRGFAQSEVGSKISTELGTKPGVVLTSRLKTDYITDKTDKYVLAETIGDIIHYLQEWESRILKALGEGKPMAALLRLGQDVLERPFLLLSRSSAVIAHTPDLSDVVGGKESEAAQGLFQEIDELLVDEAFHSGFQQAGLFYYPAYQCEGRYICSNIYADDRYLSRLISPLYGGELELNRGEEQLFYYFAKYVKQLYLKYADDSYVHHQDDRLHRALRNLLSEHSEQAAQKTADILKDYGWERGHEYLVLKLRFKEGAEWESTAQYLCGQLEKEWQYSCAIRVEAHILWTVNLTLSKLQQDVQPFFQSLAYLVREYLCQAGVSDISQDLLNARNMVLQAERALEVGQKKDPHYWYYRFDYYALDYMIEQVTSEFYAEQLCAKPLMKLVEYDRDNGTEYVKTLYEYIHSKYNITLAAKRLYVHRTTFIRRLERIRAIADIDEESMQELLHMLISFRLLGIGESRRVKVLTC